MTAHEQRIDSVRRARAKLLRTKHHYETCRQEGQHHKARVVLERVGRNAAALAERLTILVLGEDHGSDLENVLAQGHRPATDRQAP